MALGSSFTYTSPVQLQPAEEIEGSGYSSLLSSAVSSLYDVKQLCGHRMTGILWISSLKSQNC